MLHCKDWRTRAGAEVEPLVSAEARAWLRQLHWDVSDAWHVIEPARQAGQLPGFLVVNDTDRALGWTAYLRHGGSLQVMAVVAPHRQATQALVDAILSSSEAASTDVAIVCVRDGSPGLADALAGHGFQVEPYRYLSMALWDFGESTDGLRSWNEHEDAAARLCARAYDNTAGVRAFAPHGTPEEWREYVGHLRKGPGCGWFTPEFSFVAPSGDGRELEGLIMVTDLGPGTAHVAQLAVDPATRGRGLARRLVRAALGRASATFDRATLLVSSTNAPAVALYESMGFEEIATFTVATRRQPSLSTNVAVATGGESTRL